MRSSCWVVAISGKASSLWGINCTSDAEAVVISGSEGERTSEEDSIVGVEESCSVRSLSWGAAISGKASSFSAINCTSDAEAVVISGSEAELISDRVSSVGVEEG